MDKRGFARLCVMLATFALAAVSVLAIGARPVAADATSDAVNNTVTLVTNLLLAILPLILIVTVFSFVFGLLVGKSGVFSKLTGKF